jgi:choline kinase
MTSSGRHAFLILTAGAVNQELAPIFGDVPSALIPLRGKPVLMHNLQTLLRATTSDLYCVVGHKKDLIERRVFRYLKAEAKERIREIISDPRRRPGYSFGLALYTARRDGIEHVTVILGDTLVTPEVLGHLGRGEPFIAVSRTYTNPSRWALVRSAQPLQILNKPDDITTPDYPAIIGVYHLRDIQGFELPPADTEISDCLTAYSRHRPFQLVEIKDWIDIGHVDNYYAARKKFIVTRHFNQIRVDEFANLLTKSSENRDKLIAEIDWYEGLPPELKWVYPAVFATDRVRPSVTMEFVPYPSLDELYLYSDLHESTWSVVLAKLVKLLQVFNGYKATVSLDDYRDMYVDKVRLRIEELMRQNPTLRPLLEAPNLTVNGLDCLPVSQAIDALEAVLPRLWSEADHSIIHGDFCFPNILYSPESGAVKLVDPRGAWGKRGITGDIKYDYAKLLHSISGGYDSIINDYCDVRWNGSSIDASVFKPRVSEFLVRTVFDSMPYRPEVIELLEGSIFVSIAAIHREDVRRQLVMLAIGLEKITKNVGRV